MGKKIFFGSAERCRAAIKNLTIFEGYNDIIWNHYHFIK
jgi:hypothetical protein